MTRKDNTVFVKCLISLLSFVLLNGCFYRAEAKTALLSTQSADDPYWLDGRAQLLKRLTVVRNRHLAKNVILFIADGMGVSTLTATRIYDGQSKGQSGEENTLSFGQFPHVALVKTYNSDSQVPDSAGTASAMNTGVKTRRGAINTWADQDSAECYGPSKRFPASIAELAEQAGLATGIVSTARVTHATPAAVFGHSPSRGWESDANLSEQAKSAGCKDLAQQLIEFEHGNGIDVVLGGGRRHFLQKDNEGTRLDGRDLIQEWQRKNPNGRYVANAADFRLLDTSGLDQLMGLFSSSHMAYEKDRNPSLEPSIAEMTSTAIDVLAHNENGYFLMVEGGRVDHAHHGTNAHRALSDAQAFANAVQAAVDKVGDDTLILVTADHSHVFTIAGYPGRGNPILGLVHDRGSNGQGLADKPTTLMDGKPYTTLGYQLGTHIRHSGDKPLTQAQVLDVNYQQHAALPVAASGHHGGEDVALFATGPHSHLVGGVLEQNTIFHIITHALGWNFE